MHPDWHSRLAAAIHDALLEIRGIITDAIEVFAVDCAPWNGIVVLAILTRSEAKTDPLLLNISEMTAWKRYDFGAELVSWQSANEVAVEMRTEYEKAGETRRTVAERCFRECAVAVGSAVVQEALSRFELAKDFWISVANPDSGVEYYPAQK